MLVLLFLSFLFIASLDAMDAGQPVAISSSSSSSSPVFEYLCQFTTETKERDNNNKLRRSAELLTWRLLLERTADSTALQPGECRQAQIVQSGDSSKQYHVIAYCAHPNERVLMACKVYSDVLGARLLMEDCTPRLVKEATNNDQNKRVYIAYGEKLIIENSSGNKREIPFDKNLITQNSPFKCILEPKK